MEFIGFLFHEGLTRPLFNFLIVTYEVFPVRDFGIAMIIVTIGVRLLFFPISHKALRAQKILAELQPQIRELQKKYRKDTQQQTKEIMALYKEHKVNPFSGLLLLFIQLPLLLALYQVFLNGLKPEFLSNLYPFVALEQPIQPMFLGAFDLSATHSFFAILAGAAQFIQLRAIMKGKPKSQEKNTPQIAQLMGGPMVYIMPVFVAGIAWGLPAGLSLYWITTSLFSFLEQYSINRRARNEQPATNRQ